LDEIAGKGVVIIHEKRIDPSTLGGKILKDI
jgi:hypothetical protein